MFTAEVYNEKLHLFKSLQSDSQNTNTGQNKTINSSENFKNYDPYANSLYQRCRTLGINYEFLQDNEHSTETKKEKENRLNYKIRQQLKQINTKESSIPNAAALNNDEHFNKVLDCIRNFELKQMSIKFNFCIVCK